MEVLKGQTIYKCSYCGKRLLSRNGCKIHEEKYCWHKDSPNKVNMIERRKLCNHEFEEVWSYIPGEAVMQPDHAKCILCGLVQ